MRRAVGLLEAVGSIRAAAVALNLAIDGAEILSNVVDEGRLSMA
jgi:hypothetical protein